MDCSTPSFPVRHHLLEFAQVLIHWIGDAIQTSHPLSSSPSAFNLAHHQGFFPVSQLFTSGGQSIGASVSTSVHPKLNESWIFIGRTDAEAEALILWPPDVKSWLMGKNFDDGKHWGQKEKEVAEDEMVGWHHWLNEHEFEQTLEDNEGHGSLECCRPWDCKE